MAVEVAPAERRVVAVSKAESIVGQSVPECPQHAGLSDAGLAGEQDVAAFLVWTAEPELERRHAAGLAIAIFLLFATVLGYLAYGQIWAEAKRKVRKTGALDPVNQAKSKHAKREAGIRG